MFALAFDLEVAQVVLHHPSHNPTTAYGDIRKTLTNRGFEWTQGSLYVLRNEDMSILFQAIQDLTRLPWFPPSVRDIRAFRVEQWSNFTAMVKGLPTGGGPTGGSTP